MDKEINQEIRRYSEIMFFGLTLRQTLFSVAAVGVALLLYFFLRPYCGIETLSWACVLGAAPFGAMGFVSYHGMTAEQFVLAWFRSVLLEPKYFSYIPQNYFYEAARSDNKTIRKEVSE